MNPIKINKLISYLGKPITSIDIESFLYEIQVKRRPYLDETDITNGVYNQWLPIKKLGLELEFKNQSIFESLDEDKVNQTPLILVSYIFYANMDDMKDYTYKLPYNISFKDSRDEVISKVKEYGGTLKSYNRDVWTFNNHQLIVSYNKKNTEVNDITYMLLSGFENKNKPVMNFEKLMKLFGKPKNDKSLKNLFNFFDYKDYLSGQHIITPRYLAKHYGFSLDFIEGEYFENFNEEGEILSEFIFYRKNYLDFVYGYQGKLPFELSFDDSPFDFVRKINQSPIDHYEIEPKLEGHILWVFESFSIKIVYSLLLNHIARIHLYPSWYWDEEDKKDWTIEDTLLIKRLRSANN